MSTTAPRPVARVTRSFSAPAEAVFDAWLDPGLVRIWMAAAVADGPGGVLERVEIDARVGGAFTFSDRRNGEEAVHEGTYLEIDRPRRLVFTWMAEPGTHSVVTIEIRPAGDRCSLVLAHEMDPEWSEFVDRTAQGWTIMIEHIARCVDGGVA